MTGPDRMAHAAQCQQEAAGKVAPILSREDTRTHQGELVAAHLSSTVANTPASGEGRGQGDAGKYGG